MGTKIHSRGFWPIRMTPLACLCLARPIILMRGLILRAWQILDWLATNKSSSTHLLTRGPRGFEPQHNQGSEWTLFHDVFSVLHHSYLWTCSSSDVSASSSLNWLGREGGWVLKVSEAILLGTLMKGMQIICLGFLLLFHHVQLCGLLYIWSVTSHGIWSPICTFEGEAIGRRSHQSIVYHTYFCLLRASVSSTCRAIKES